MIDLTQSTSASPAVHKAPGDPGLSWIKKAKVAIEAPPDSDLKPAPEAHWPSNSVRTGLAGAVAPRVLRLSDGSYRLYYSQILPRPGNPTGANDYDNATTRILSATSIDGTSWVPEPGVRLSPEQGGAGNFRVVSAEVVPVPHKSGQYRMYYECCTGPQSSQNSIRSALSIDGGLSWVPEAGVRLESPKVNYKAPRIIFLDDGRVRLYVTEHGAGIMSAISADGGFTFQLEPGYRIPEDSTSFAPEIVLLPSNSYRMYYVSNRAQRVEIVSAVSVDGLSWRREAGVVIAPAGSGPDAAKCSEMCLFPLPIVAGQMPNYGMLYEACDGSTPNQRGVWRIARAFSGQDPSGGGSL